MKRLLLPFFIVRLGLSLFPFALQLAWLWLGPFLGLAMMISLVFLYGLLFARHFLNLQFWDEQPALPASASLSSTSEALEAKIVAQSSHKLWYRDDTKLKLIQAQITELLHQNPTHRDLLLNNSILEEVHPTSSDSTEIGTRSAYNQARYVDHNSSLF